MLESTLTYNIFQISRFTTEQFIRECGIDEIQKKGTNKHRMEGISDRNQVSVCRNKDRL